MDLTSGVEVGEEIGSGGTDYTGADDDERGLGRRVGYASEGHCNVILEGGRLWGWM